MSIDTSVLRSQITLPPDRIGALCEKYQVTELSVFGSVLRDEFGPDSDVDVLVEFRDGDAGPWMSKVFALEEELAALLGRKIDVVMKGGVERSDNAILRRAILETAQIVYRAPVEPDGSSVANDRTGVDPDVSSPGMPPLVLARIRYEPGRVAEFCGRHHISRLALFGSVLRDDFSPESDVDVLVEFEPGKSPAWEFFGMERELTAQFGRRVDLNTPGFLSRYFRDQVQNEAMTLYESETRVDRHGSAAAHA
jgi:predicted nucleotidyltransferase